VLHEEWPGIFVVVAELQKIWVVVLTSCLNGNGLFSACAVCNTCWDDQDTNEFLVGAISNTDWITSKIVDGNISKSCVEVSSELISNSHELFNFRLNRFNEFSNNLLIWSLGVCCTLFKSLSISLNLFWISSLEVPCACAWCHTCLIEWHRFGNWVETERCAV